MTKKLFTLGALIFIVSFDVQARIRNNKVKDPPRTCATMKEEEFLSRPGKKVFGTLRNSVVIEDDLSVISDLGKKICQFPLEKINQYGNITDFKYYVDEYKNVLYPYVKQENGYFVMKVAMNDCSIVEEVTKEQLDFPKCEKPSKKKSRSKKRAKA